MEGTFLLFNKLEIEDLGVRVGYIIMTREENITYIDFDTQVISIKDGIVDVYMADIGTMYNDIFEDELFKEDIYLYFKESRVHKIGLHITTGNGGIKDINNNLNFSAEHIEFTIGEYTLHQRTNIDVVY